MENTTSSSKRTIKRFDPLQLGKIFAVVYGGLALLLAPFMILLALAGGHQSGGLPQSNGFVGTFGIGFAIAFPFIYAIAGFIGGILGAFIYNIAAKIVGGIQLEVEIE
jgi:hypothetical protein